MVQINTRKLLFTKQSYWFSAPHEVEGCDAAFFYATEENVDLPGFKRTESKTLTIQLDQDADALMKNMSKSCRYEVNRAGREGLVVKKDTDAEAFYEIYSEFVDAKGFSGDLDMFWNFVENGALYTCYWNDELISGLLTLQDDKHSRWILSGSKRLSSDDKQVAMISGLSNRLLVWQAMLDAKDSGKQVFDLGGYFDGDDESHPEYRIARFKKGFGGESVTQYKYQKTYSSLLKAAKHIKKSG
ncbi:peptidoglycan bridge formation glycyltransferase FemA/FemB family protein [Oceanobacter kriegii]|uniref:peptidoglycan bridge formation glycyltransferase FemA/FemB family protein n=1 Tax=Oceanobacter kriegii TaxID=64972 RepID=UPI0004025440|nr:peptidoglycan bridge formation glycyltransferase FemA/FemB family protein [Oceanobacter kriegii]